MRNSSFLVGSSAIMLDFGPFLRDTEKKTTIPSKLTYLDHLPLLRQLRSQDITFFHPYQPCSVPTCTPAIGRLHENLGDTAISRGKGARGQLQTFGAAFIFPRGSWPEISQVSLTPDVNYVIVEPCLLTT